MDGRKDRWMDEQTNGPREREGLQTWKTLLSLLSGGFIGEPHHLICHHPFHGFPDRAHSPQKSREPDGQEWPGKVESRSSESLWLHFPSEKPACHTPTSPPPMDTYLLVAIWVGLLRVHTGGNPGLFVFMVLS